MFGGSGDRFAAAKSLVEAELADTLVISDPHDQPVGQPPTAFAVFCGGGHRYETICFDPQPRTTRGESRFVADLATKRRWRRLIIVTTTEQAYRARMLVGRCWDGVVDIVVVDTDLNRIGRVAYEWGATARAVLFRRGC